MNGPQFVSTACVGLWVALITGACSTTPRIEIVLAEPVGCTFLDSVWVYQVGHAPPTKAALAELAEKARSLGGNTLQCCKEGDTLVVYGIDRRTGRAVPDALEHIGRVYNCPSDQHGLTPNTSPARTREQ
jgi:hypothetical protein